MSDKYMKYIGKEKGSIPGIPARDLTYKEAQDIGIVYLLQTGLYVLDFKEHIPEQYKADLLTTEPPAAQAAETKEEKPKRTTKRRKE